MNNLEKLLADLERLEKEANSGPWEYAAHSQRISAKGSCREFIAKIHSHDDESYASMAEEDGNGNLIVTLRNNAPLLVSALRECIGVLELAQQGLDLAHSCGLPPDDCSGRKMWADSQEIRIKTRECLDKIRNISESK